MWAWLAGTLSALATEDTNWELIYMKPICGRAAALVGWFAVNMAGLIACGGDGGAQGGTGEGGAGAQGGTGEGGGGGACDPGGSGAGNPAPSECSTTYLPLGSAAAAGDYLLSLSFPQDPSSPTLFLAKISASAAGCAGGIGMSVTALDKTDRKTPVGEAQDLGTAPLGPDGGFVFEVPALVIPAKAFTIAPIEATVTATLAGHACGDSSFLCGILSGTVVSPKVSMDGSTFALQRITDPQTYPDPVLNCAQDPADPL
jgi:hypothetical protein